MDGEIEKGARAPISQGHPGSSLAAAPMTFPAARRWSGGLGAGRRVVGRQAAPRVAGPEALVFLGS